MGGQEWFLRHLAEIQSNRIICGDGVDVTNGILHIIRLTLELFVSLVDFFPDVFLAEIDSQVIQFVQNGINGIQVVTLLFQQFHDIFDGDVTPTLGPIHEFLNHLIMPP